MIKCNLLNNQDFILINKATRLYIANYIEVFQLVSNFQISINYSDSMDLVTSLWRFFGIRYFLVISSREMKNKIRLASIFSAERLEKKAGKDCRKPLTSKMFNQLKPFSLCAWFLSHTINIPNG